MEIRSISIWQSINILILSKCNGQYSGINVQTVFSIHYIPDAAGVLMPLVVRPTVTVEVEGPLMANVEKSNLEEKILCKEIEILYRLFLVIAM